MSRTFTLHEAFVTKRPIEVRPVATSGRAASGDHYVDEAKEFHFAYGTNVRTDAMAARCPGASAPRRALLDGYRLTFGTSGWPTILPDPSGTVEGLLWSIDAQALHSLDEYEKLDAGLYVRRPLAVRAGDDTVVAHVYLEASFAEGTPRAGLVAALLEAAANANLAIMHARLLELQ